MNRSIIEPLDGSMMADTSSNVSTNQVEYASELYGRSKMVLSTEQSPGPHGFYVVVIEHKNMSFSQLEPGILERVSRGRDTLVLEYTATLERNRLLNISEHCWY